MKEAHTIYISSLTNESLYFDLWERVTVPQQQQQQGWKQQQKPQHHQGRHNNMKASNSVNIIKSKDAEAAGMPVTAGMLAT
jgi:hypothetical protein